MDNFLFYCIYGRSTSRLMWKSKSGVGKNQLRPSAGKIRMLHLLVVGNEPVPISVWRGDRDSAIGSGDMPANRQTDT